MFDSLKKGVAVSATPPERVFPKFTNVELTINTLVEKLKSIEVLSDNEIKNIIYRQYHTILNYDLFLANEESRIVAQKLFTNERFLNALIICAQDLQLNDHQIICCNKLAYDYIALYPITEKNQTISSLLMELSFRVNFKTVLPLSALIGVDNAKYLAMLRKSSFKEEKNIIRVNRFLIKSGLELKESDMIDIYSKLYTHISSLFITTMFTIAEDNYTKLEFLRYEEMSKALIDILDSMPSAEIKIVLSNYVSSYLLNGEPPIRFSMKNIHESYGRIKQVINNLLEEGIIVP